MTNKSLRLTQVAQLLGVDKRTAAQKIPSEFISKADPTKRNSPLMVDLGAYLTKQDNAGLLYLLFTRLLARVERLEEDCCNG